MNISPGHNQENTNKFNYLDASMHATNLAQLLQQAGFDIAQHVGMNERILADRLTSHAKQNPSDIGGGVAIMNLRISGLNAPFQALIRLKKPIAAGAYDGQDVDLYCLLLTPDRDGNSYLRTLSRLSRLLRNKTLQSRLRAAQDTAAMRLILEQPEFVKNAA